MTNDERAIRWFENELRLLHGAPKLNGCDMTQEWQEQIDVMETALNAIKRSAPHKDPLTLEQLRQMDGECVKVVVDDVEPLEMLALVEVPKDEDCVLLRNNLGGVSEFYGDEDLRDDGVKVYAYTPAHIDRKAWESCKSCVSCDNCENSNVGEFCNPCFRCLQSDKKDGFSPVGFCRECGRPLTEEAWTELKKRLMGCLYGN